MPDTSESEESDLDQPVAQPKRRNQDTDAQNNKKQKKNDLEIDSDNEEGPTYEDDEEYYRKFMESTSKLPLNDEDDLKRQLRLEKEYAEKKAADEAEASAKDNQVKTRIDPDGTEYEWDPAMKGWFPKLNDNRFIQYLQSYNSAQQSSSQQQTQFKPDENTFYYMNGTFYKWDVKENKWLNVTDPVYAYVDYMTGVSFEWNAEENSWKSKGPVTNDAQQSTNTTKQQTQQKDADASNKSNEKKEATWFEINDEKNTNVYVSGLPPDITDDEFQELMSKYGIIMKDPATNKLKIKLYRDEQNQVKGDGRCCYLMPESVKLCLQLLDGSMYKSYKVKVEKAKFEMKGTNYDPSKSVLTPAQKKKLNKAKEKKLIEKQRQKLLDWEDRPEVVRKKHEKVVVIKNIFNPEDVRRDSTFSKRLKEDLKTELSVHGTVKRILIHEKHPDGIVTVSFTDVDMADDCCDYMDNKVWKNGRIISCQIWDGETKYEVEETEEEREARLAEWQRFLESGANDEDD